MGSKAPEGPRAPVDELTAPNVLTPPARSDKDPLRSTMIDLLLRDNTGLSAERCGAVVDAIQCSRPRFRGIRANLKHHPEVARAFDRGGVPLEGIVDLSAFR